MVKFNLNFLGLSVLQEIFSANIFFTLLCKFFICIQNRNSTKTYETKCFDLQTEKNNLERQVIAEEAKSREVFQKINDIQVHKTTKTIQKLLKSKIKIFSKLFLFLLQKNELELLRNERKEFESYIQKLESECQVKHSLNSKIFLVHSNSHCFFLFIFKKKKLKSNLDNVERAEQEAKLDLNNFSKQAIQVYSEKKSLSVFLLLLNWL